MSFVSPFAVLGFLVNLSAAAAFFVAVFVYSKRIGGAGPWLVAAAAGLDAGMIVLFRLAMLGAGARPYYEVEHSNPSAKGVFPDPGAAGYDRARRSGCDDERRRPAERRGRGNGGSGRRRKGAPPSMLWLARA